MAGFVLKWGTWSLDLSVRPLVMGVVNVTPDSFSDGGDFLAAETAIRQGLDLAAAGADILDLGGESTRPGAEFVSEEEEKARVLPVIEALAGRIGIPISIDTYKAGVARAALAAGAAMVNDISAGLFQPEILRVAARAGVPVALMHIKGEPRNMQKNPVYEDIMGEIKAFLADAVRRAEEAGVRSDLIILDPGLGFGKTYDHNLILINRLGEFKTLGKPLLVGPSRKAFLGHVLGGAPPRERDGATAVVAALAAYNGADILRVHQVRPVRETMTVVRAVMAEHA
ncbi:MAG: dihydropteroate synthase [Pseudomonadota bacterium]